MWLLIQRGANLNRLTKAAAPPKEPAQAKKKSRLLDALPRGLSCLHLAAMQGHLNVARLLIQFGALAVNPGRLLRPTASSIADSSPRSILDGESEHTLVGNDDEKGTPRESWATSDKKEACSPCFLACFRGHVNVVRLLLENGGDANYVEPRMGMSLTHVAAQEGHVDVVALLIQYGADSDTALESGQTPCMAAIRRGHVDVVQLLIESGADLCKTMAGGLTPLTIARKQTPKPVRSKMVALVKSASTESSPTKTV